VDSGVQVDLYGTETTSRGMFAVGGGGIVLNRTETGWKKVLQGGPSGNGNSLYAVSVTEDGHRLWFAGSSGELGEMDVRTGDVNDRSSPLDSGDNFKTISVKGDAGEANVYAATASGHLYYNFDNGKQGKWQELTPGSGSNINGASFYGPKEGQIVDGNQEAFRTDDGETYDKFGVPDADETLFDVDAHAKDDTWVAASGGVVYRYNGVQWKRSNLGTDSNMKAIDIERDNSVGYVVGNGGVVFRLTDASKLNWQQESTPVGDNLKGVRSDEDSSLVVAVGASGTILEREQ